VEYDSETPEVLGPLLRLARATLRSGVARKDGLLTLEFTDGTRLIAPPNERFEAWQATGELPPITSRFQLIALPGGGLASF